MNYKHLEAMWKIGYRRSAQYGEQRLLTDGHILFPFSGEFEVGESKDAPAAACKLWGDALAFTIKPAEIGGLFGNGVNLCRKVGEVFIAERYVRCFGEGVTWTPTGDYQKPVLVHRDGILLGAVMPMREYGDENRHPAAATDTEVFGPYACAENDWYLQDAHEIKELLDEAESELDDAQRKLEEARSEMEGALRTIESLRARRKVLLAVEQAKGK